MKITRLETMLVGLGFRNCILVALHTDAGLIGYGETVLKRHSRTVEASLHELSRYLVGKDPTGIEDHFEKMYRDSFWVGGPLHASAISAVDVALWDLKGKVLDVPLYKLLGGPTRDEVPIYCHCPAGATPEQFVANLKHCQECGYFAAKTTLPLFYGDRQDKQKGYSGRPGSIPATLKETEYLPSYAIRYIAEFFAAAREALGDNFEIAVDCHGRLSPAMAIRLCEELEPYHLLFVEEPVPPEDPAALREVATRTRIPIASGERLATIYEVRPFLDARSVSLLQVDLANCGGITAGKKIAALAESYYVPLCPHNPNGPLATAAAVHLLAAIPNAYMLETVGSLEDVMLQRQMAMNSLEPQDGKFRLPEGPGLGVEPLPDAGERFPYKPFSGWR